MSLLFELGRYKISVVSLLFRRLVVKLPQSHSRDFPLVSRFSPGFSVEVAVGYSVIVCLLLEGHLAIEDMLSGMHITFSTHTNKCGHDRLMLN